MLAPSPRPTRQPVRPTPPVPARWSGAGPDLANIYLHARYYDSALGIFLSPDPIGADSNTYRYSYGDSVNFSDPTGLDPSIPFDPCLVWDTLCRGEGVTVPGIGGSPGGADLTWWYSWGLSVAALSFSRRLPIDVFSSVSAALIRGPEAEREQEPGPQRAQLCCHRAWGQAQDTPRLWQRAVSERRSRGLHKGGPWLQGPASLTARVTRPDTNPIGKLPELRESLQGNSDGI